MIRDQMVVMTKGDESVKIMQAEEAREEKSAPPERIRDPVIHIVIIPRRRVVSDHRRTFLIVIIVYRRGIRLGLVFSILARAARRNGQTELRCQILKCLQGIILLHCQFMSVSRTGHGVLQLADDNGRYRVIGNPPVLRRDVGRGQHILRLCLAAGCS